MVMCTECKIVFKQNSSRPNHKFCSAKCRNRNWVKNNPNRDKELKKRWRYKIPKLCKDCKVVLQRINGKQYCESCATIRTTNSQRHFKYRQMQRFHKFKTNLGCCKCKYNKYGGSLDFHHTNPTTKLGRISAENFETTNEIKKCILVCKNCHYEIHSMEKLLFSQTTKEQKS